MDTLLISFIVLGVALVVAAVVGGGLQAFGYNFPIIPGWQRQVAAGLVGLILAVLSWTIYDLRQRDIVFQTSFLAIANGAAGVPPPPWSPQQISVRLDDLVTQAGTDTLRNCKVAAIIEEYKVSPIPFVVREDLQDSQTSNAVWLKCYRDIVTRAVAHATVNTTGTTGSPRAELATSAPATAILEAVTTTNTRGWMYLGRLQADESLAQGGRTISQDRVQEGDAVTTTTGVYLHARATAGHRSDGKVTGVVPTGSTVTILSVSPPSEPYEWAEVSIAQKAAETPQPSVTPALSATPSPTPAPAPT